MSKKKVNQTRDPLRRQSILDAALATFTKFGYSETTLAMICKESGSSVGSVYHFFSGKAEIAYELICEATEGWASESGSPAITPTDPESAIKASVRGLLIWASKNEALFKFMEEMRAKAGTDNEFIAFNQLFIEGQNKASELYLSWVKKGLVQNIPWPIAYSLIMGPSYLFLHNKPVGKKINQDDILHLIQMAWTSVKK